MLTLGEVKAQAVLFTSPMNDKNFYVCGLDDMDFMEFRNRYDNAPGNAERQYKRATALCFDDSYDRFFMVYVADCFDPPIAIIRAENECEALEIFADELEWAHIGETDLPDYLKPADERREGDSEYVDSVSWNSSGKPYETESIQMHEIRLHSVENF